MNIYNMLNWICIIFLKKDDEDETEKVEEEDGEEDIFR